MTDKEVFDNIVFQRRSSNMHLDDIYKDDIAQVYNALEILQIIKEHLHIYENDAFAFADAFAMYWGAGSSDSEYKKYNEEEYRKKERVKEWWKEWYYPNYKKGE